MSKYDVGYKKPPKHSQFKPGESGNPKGRKKGKKNFKTELLEEMYEKVVIQEKGKPCSISKQRVLLKQQINKAMQGDTQSAKLLLGWMQQIVVEEESKESCAVDSMPPSDAEILEYHLNGIAEQ